MFLYLLRPLVIARRYPMVCLIQLMVLSGILLALSNKAESFPHQIPNPIMFGADPHASVVGKTVWIYPTWNTNREAQFFAFSSSDLQNWTQHGPVLNFRNVRWIEDDGVTQHYAWAPGVIEKGGKFYFYYSVGLQGVTPSRIGVAASEKPAGPFLDSGKPLLTGGNGFEAIDPMAFSDQANGRSYLYAGGSAGAKLRVFELSRDMVSFSREIMVDTPPMFTEGAFMHWHNGTYYLSYSHGGWRDASYSAHYATAPSATGPWTYRGAFLSSDDHHKGPGHHSIIRHPLTHEWLVVYHRWNDQLGKGPYEGSRQICIDHLEYDPAGLIKTVSMTGGN